MAGIGFSLRKMIKSDDAYSTRVHAWFHTAIVSAGPWIISIVTINLILAFSRRWNLPFVERELLISAIIYSTLFSQILTAPFQMVITRYIADRIYKEEYEYIKPSFWGSSALVSLIALSFGIWFYRKTEIPIEFLYLSVALMVVLSVLWMLIVYQSTMKNFKLVTMSNILGTFVTFILILILANNPMQFSEFSGSTNLLLAYLGGIVFFTMFLLIALLSEMKEDNGKVLHFIRYFHSEPSLWPIGVIYTLAIWIDNVIMWFSPISIELFGTFRYAPFYDIATFYSYLSILPSTMLFMVLIETDFSVKCREFFLAVLRNGPFSELKVFAERMWSSLNKNILQTFEIQLFITIIIIVLSRSLFPLLNVPESSRQIFMIYALGAFCNSFILIFMQVLLYIGERNKTLLLMVVFLVTNVIFTLLSLSWGENFYGFGFFLASFVTMLFGLYLMIMGYRDVISHTYRTQPVHAKTKSKTFEKLEEWIDKRMTDQDALDRLLLEKKRKDAIERGENLPDAEDELFGVQDRTQLESEKDAQLLANLFGGADAGLIKEAPEAETETEAPAEPEMKEPVPADEEIVTPLEILEQEEKRHRVRKRKRQETEEHLKETLTEILEEPAEEERDQIGEILDQLLTEEPVSREETVSELHDILEDILKGKEAPAEPAPEVKEPAKEERDQIGKILDHLLTEEPVSREETVSELHDVLEDILKGKETPAEPAPEVTEPAEEEPDQIGKILDHLLTEESVSREETVSELHDVLEDILKGKEAAAEPAPEETEQEETVPTPLELIESEEEDMPMLGSLLAEYGDELNDIPSELISEEPASEEQDDQFIRTFTGIVLDAEEEEEEHDEQVSLQDMISNYLKKEDERNT